MLASAAIYEESDDAYQGGAEKSDSNPPLVLKDRDAPNHKDSEHDKEGEDLPSIRSSLLLLYRFPLKNPAMLPLFDELTENYLGSLRVGLLIALKDLRWRKRATETLSPQ